MVAIFWISRKPRRGALPGQGLRSFFDRTRSRIHVEHDASGRAATVHKVDPLAGQIGNSREVLGCRKPLRLEAAHLARLTPHSSEPSCRQQSSASPDHDAGARRHSHPRIRQGDQYEAFVRTIKRDYGRVSPRPDAQTVMHQLSASINHYNEVHPTRLSDIVHPVSLSQLTGARDRVRSFGGYNNGKRLIADHSGTPGGHHPTRPIGQAKPWLRAHTATMALGWGTLSSTRLLPRRRQTSRGTSRG
jgi:hypothetical protein